MSKRLQRASHTARVARHNAMPAFDIHEQQLISAYRQLDAVSRLAIRAYLCPEDERLLAAVFHQAFLRLLPGQFPREAGEQLGKLPTSVQVHKSPFFRR